MTYSPFAISYLPITYLSELINLKSCRYRYRLLLFFNELQLPLPMGPSVSFPLPPRVSCALHACLSVCVCVCVCSRLVSSQKPRPFFLGGCFLFQKPGHLAAISLKGLCFWPIVPGKLSLISSQFLLLSLSFSSYKQEQRQRKGTGEVGERERFGERKLGRKGLTSWIRKMVLFDPRPKPPLWLRNLFPEEQMDGKVTEF